MATKTRIDAYSTIILPALFAISNYLLKNCPVLLFSVRMFFRSH